MKKKILLGLLFGIGLLLTRPIIAKAANTCKLNECRPEATNYVCGEGKIEECIRNDIAKTMICCSGTWSELGTCGEDPQAFCSDPTNPPYLPIVGGDTPYDKFLRALGANAGMSLDRWISGTYAVDSKNGSSGFWPANFNSITVSILGVPPQSEKPGETGSIGAVGTIAGLMGTMYQHAPASSQEYFAYLGRNIGVTRSAYAAEGRGIGFSGMNSLIPIWRVFRDISYLLFIIIFIVIGFAIMFRVKLDPQTVISIQNSIPKLVLTLLLITFSYAIAGLVIDMIYVLSSLIITILSPAGGSDFNYNRNVFSFAADLFGNIFGGNLTTNLASEITKFVQDIMSFTKGPVFGFTIDILAQAIIAIAILFTLFKIFFILIGSYVGLIISVIFSPIMLLVEAMPGQNGFSNWIRSLASNAIVFPTTVGIFALVSVINKTVAGNPDRIWIAPGIGAGQTGSGFLQLVIGLGALLAAPTIINSVKQGVSGSKGGGGLAGAALAGFAAGARPLQAVGRGVGSAVSFIPRSFEAGVSKGLGDKMAGSVFPSLAADKAKGKGKPEDKRH